MLDAQRLRENMRRFELAVYDAMVCSIAPLETSPTVLFCVFY